MRTGRHVGQTEEGIEPNVPLDSDPPSEALAPISGTVKWFNSTRGFGFLVSEEIDGDVLIYFSALRDHQRRSLPEGAVITCIPFKSGRGFQVEKILSIDVSTALPSAVRGTISAAERADRQALIRDAGEFEPVEVKWFNRVRGYGFVT